MKNRGTGKTSIWSKLTGYLAVPAGFCIFVFVLSNLFTSKNMENSQEFFSCSQNLSAFYSNVTEMDTAARSYVYEHIVQNEKVFEDLLERARENLANIRGIVDAKTEWRIERLDNMLDYYCQPLEDFENGSGSAYEVYNELYYRRNLITRTAADYYEYLADYMKEETDSIQTAWRRLRDLQFILLLFVLVFAVLMSRLYSKSICTPIEAMVRNSRKLKKGDFSFEIIESDLNEFDILTESFADMAHSIEKNVETLQKNAELERSLLKQENDNLLMKNLLTEAELKSLQAQINPHFLFNTLSMISKSAYMSGNTEICEMMEKLSEFLHYALEKANKNSTLYEEIESTKNYLYIQKKRFSDRICFDMNVEEDVPDIRMPAVVLQPLVENAISHGVNGVMKQAAVNISVSSHAGRVRISVEDNGVGMEAEKLEDLQSKLEMGLESSDGGSGHGIGLSNVYRRLKMYFGEEMQFVIESAADCGTVITLILPVQEV